MNTYKITIVDENSIVLNVIEVTTDDLKAKFLATTIGEDIIDEIERAEERKSNELS